MTIRVVKWIVFASLITLSVSGNANGSESVCYGTPDKGKLAGGVKLPLEGRNFAAVSRLAAFFERTYVHATVRDVVVEAYKSLERETPGSFYTYAETGFKEGGLFLPHRTHRNGLSVDFMVPLVNKMGRSTYLKILLFTMFGHPVEFDKKARYSDYKMDFEAMAAHIVALHKTSLKRGIGIKRVIFDPELQPFLFITTYAPYLKAHITFSKKSSWPRHNEHYHIDFDIACRPL